MNLKTKLIMVVMLLVNIQLFAQNSTITGNITDADGLPVAGANIIVVNTCLLYTSDAADE